MKKLYIGTNTKMYKTIEETIEFLKELGKCTESISRDEMELFVIPSFTTLYSAKSIAKNANITLGAQNMAWEDRAALTGEISPLMLKEVGVNIVELGHSERRHIMGETDEMQRKKINKALSHNFWPLLCIGETLEQKENGIADEVLKTQLKIALGDVMAEQADNLWVAYEPVWAIGESGQPATPDYAAEKHKVIRDTLIELFGQNIGDNIPILYGGSVNNENAPEFIVVPNVDGLFIGRSAWDAKNFVSIIEEVLPLMKNK